MLCEKCEKNQATFHYTEVVNGVKNEHHLCSECAANTDMSYYSTIFDNDQFGKLLSGILGGQNIFKGDKESDPAKNIMCPRCKLSYGEFIADSSFGCSECYDVFGPLITNNIKKIQGSDTHIGKSPMMHKKEDAQPKDIFVEESVRDIEAEIEYYTRLLKEAVVAEEFLEAARLRDLIADLKGQVK